MYKCLYRYIFSFPLGEKLLGLCLTFLEAENLFSNIDAPFCIPASNVWEFHFLHILTNTIIAFLKIIAILVGVRWYLTVVFIFTSLQ